MIQAAYDAYLGGELFAANHDLIVTDKYSNQPVSRVPLADESVLLEAIDRANQAVQPMRAMKAYERRDVLNHCVHRFLQMKEELATSLCVEAGKPINDARGEVTRLIETFGIAAEESTRCYGEVLPMDISARTAHYQGMWKRVPVGPCSFISPFNFPLNLAAHKIAPAIAAGCPFILKPASLTPIGALMIGQVLTETNLPKGAFSILPCHRDAADVLVEDERLKLLSFTGSPSVGWALKSRAGKKKVVLELGGNAAVMIEPDADLADAVERLILGAFYQSGQVCISVQRILIHESIYAEMSARLVDATQQLPMGDPKNESTWIGPMISMKEADRLRGWINQAMEQGARLLCGGVGEGVMLPASLLEGVPAGASLSCEEAFGPVALLEPYKTFEEGLYKINQSKFGLQAGLFTHDLNKMYRAWDVLEVGGVCINEVPAFRVDHMPYGGVKESGLGREGIRFAMQDMTEPRLLVVRGIH